MTLATDLTNARTMKVEIAAILAQTAQLRVARMEMEIEAMVELYLYPLDCGLCGGTGLAQSWAGIACSSCGGTGVTP